MGPVFAEEPHPAVPHWLAEQMGHRAEWGNESTTWSRFRFVAAAFKAAALANRRARSAGSADGSTARNRDTRKSLWRVL